MHVSVVVCVHVCNLGGDSSKRHRSFSVLFFLQFQQPTDAYLEKYIYIYILINDISAHEENDLNTVVPPLTANHKSKSHLPRADGCVVIYIF